MRKKQLIPFIAGIIALATTPAILHAEGGLFGGFFAGLFGKHCHRHAPDCGCKMCVAVPAKKKISHVEYNVKCVDFCAPRCRPFCLFNLFGVRHHHGCGGQDGCPNSECSNWYRVRTKHVLLKRVITRECPDYQCKPVPMPPCAGCLPAPGANGKTILPPGTVVPPGADVVPIPQSPTRMLPAATVGTPTAAPTSSSPIIPPPVEINTPTEGNLPAPTALPAPHWR